ncbi:putative amp-binding enzyme [Phaeomoniella chlamydospora]|uniref:Putative amp-binding enzyme n=1 Tax=Phaeomoniella chlamydospora TaxID=158046 RepID=A0A0G2GQM6_PHACM|nr:putative amp-binding enzyme [Phaeomoniella chlamydospora]
MDIEHQRDPFSPKHTPKDRLKQPPLLTDTVPGHFKKIVDAHGDRTAIKTPEPETYIQWTQQKSEQPSQGPPRINVPIFKDITDDLSARKFSSQKIPSLEQVILVENSGGGVESDQFQPFVPFTALLESSLTDNEFVPTSALDPYDIVNIQFTSGTTSMPKAAWEAFSPSATLEAVVAERGTALYGVPTMFISELDHLAFSPVGKFPPDGFASLRTGIAAGSPIAAALMRKLHRIFNLTELTICYGMTETSPVSFMTTTDDPMDKRVNSVGRLMPHVRGKIVDPHDRSRILQVGERGELAVSGYLTMQGYWNDEKRTSDVLVKDESIKEGDYQFWMHTGDEALMDEEGYVRITGRIKDLIIRGGENIHPGEIENCLLSHAAVSDASVVGLKDYKYGEEVAAFVILQNSKKPRVLEDSSAIDILMRDFEARRVATTLREHVAKHLSRHLVPKRFFFVDDYPKTASGKVQKYKLREMGEALLG